jgi:hypothetical protein
MCDYLTSLQEKYTEYKKQEKRLRHFLDKCMGGDIDNISFDDGKVIIVTTKKCRGETFRETYRVPFSYFDDVDTFVNNILIFRD